MARPPTLLEDAERIHGDLMTKAKPGTRIPRAQMDRILVQGYRKSITGARYIIETGVAAGLWSRHPGPSNRHWVIELHAAPVALLL
jgi:hypothetical protein